MAAPKQALAHHIHATGHPAAYGRVYVWEVPVRIYHWINALCMVTLIASGFLIGNPQAIFYANEAYQQYWFGFVRVFHFSAAFIFFFNYLARLYWAFAGNRYARWDNFIPLRREQWHELSEVIRVDILQLRLRRIVRLGHNALASLSYLAAFLVFLFQSATGFALYADMSSSWIPKLFRWVVPLMGGDATVRQWHHAMMWFFILFIIVHVYIVFYHDYVEGRGTTSSMISGWEFEHTGEDK
ncbi:MAG TPA: Ni/Fe-hydrogenase, b-type cytochrome subunit [Blastocatellia bacterium]|nr:Ni/Fe-hydrogenase, b-type cytochrome subunit [Blastocatellia bacterium]